MFAFPQRLFRALALGDITINANPVGLSPPCDRHADILDNIFLPIRSIPRKGAPVHRSCCQGIEALVICRVFNRLSEFLRDSEFEQFLAASSRHGGVPIIALDECSFGGVRIFAVNANAVKHVVEYHSKSLFGIPNGFRGPPSLFDLNDEFPVGSD